MQVREIAQVSGPMRRRRWERGGITAALAFVTALLASTPSAQAVTGAVERVIDGDTVVVAGIGTVRLIGVDTPETVDPRTPVQHFGAEASAFTTSIAHGQPVRLEYEGPTRDKYNRTLAYVYLTDGRMLNEELIREGFAHAYTAFPFSRIEAFRTLEREAREHGRGFWHAHSEVAAEPQTGTAATTVYVTRTGAKYHRAGCRHLARSQIAMSLKDASARYGPCSVCKPPTLAAVAESVPLTSARSVAAPAKAGTAATSERCQAITKKGTQCSRRAQPGRAYCWQH